MKDKKTIGTKKIESFFGNEITDMSQFFVFLDILNRSEKKYIFRGQSNSNLDYDGVIKKNEFVPWELESSLRRKFGENNHQNNSIVLNFATSGIIDEIKNTTSQQDGLEILSEMQHFRKATILIDFTSDFLFSIFFAFSNENFSDVGEGFVSIYFKKIETKLKYKLKGNIAKWDNIYVCPKTIQRGISQRSYFILDNVDNLVVKNNITLI